jgi:L-ascorbate metabolism protein UlaG (beta-lactamase superfamily)
MTTAAPAPSVNGEALPAVTVPLGLKAWFAGRGIRDVTELDWWDDAEFRGLKFTLTPVQHWSSRTLWDRDKTLWGGWVVEQPDFRFFFAGDTGYAGHFGAIAQRWHDFDLALLPFGAYEPRWFWRRAYCPGTHGRTRRSFTVRRHPPRCILAFIWG